MSCICVRVPLSDHCQVDRLAEILEALDTDEPGDALHYVRLFSDDDDLNQGLTAEIIRSQHLTERLEYLQVNSCAAVAIVVNTPDGLAPAFAKT